MLANNDAVSRIVKIPVYLNNDRESKVELQTLASTVVYTYGGYLVVQTDKALSSISLVNMNGAVMKMQNVDGYTTNMSLDNLQTGIYCTCRWKPRECKNTGRSIAPEDHNRLKIVSAY